ncbi:MAG: FtsX-like permease family protein [Kordiimonadaceae bacterium]|jgi:putative ABC transport system permease protein|nr:FtsX-like permease family protein [Kordiimonadaceae bacterium]MBT6036993.1 FtsX-like permease family protein [Kordiimonadaceae bacterium]
MYKNYFTTAFRNMMRHKLYSLINIGGLAIGLAACILIFLFVKDELSYDDWGTGTDNLYRLEASYKQSLGEDAYMALSPGRLRDSLADSFQQEFSAIARLYRNRHILLKDGNAFREQFWAADKQLFDIFDIEMVSGNRTDVFLDNRSVIINQTMALKYYGTDDPVGQILEPDDQDFGYKIVGVMKDLPENSHLDFNFLILFDPERYVDTPWVAELWLSSNVLTYVKLADGVLPGTIEASIPDFLDRTVIRSEQPGLEGDPSDFFNVRLMPVSDIHLYSTGRFQMKPGGDIKVVYSFAVIALLILFIASINFINLSTARSSLRAREIALRKVVGARRGQLITQFLGEAGLMVLVALVFALAIVEFSLPWFNGFVAKLLSLNYGSDPMTSLVLIGLLVVVGIGAGIHPAMQITRFRPAAVLRSNNSSATGGSKLRAILVTVQFAISIGLIATTIIVYSQTNYTSNKDLGFETKNRLTLDNMDYQSIEPVADTILQEIERLPGVLNTAYTARSIPLFGFWDFPIQKRDETDPNQYRLEMVPGDLNFLEFLGARTIAGRIFSKDFRADAVTLEEQGGTILQKNAVINLATVNYLNLGTPEQALGQEIKFEGFGGQSTQMTVIGVIEDMHMRSLRDEVEPLALHVEEDSRTVLNIELDPLFQEETVAAINMIWKAHVPAFPIDLTYMDENFGRLYEADAQRGQMFGYFSIFAVIVSCLGLFGLSSFTAEQRTKEIGVRKVYGAGSMSIVRLLVWQFSKPVLVANVIAWPIAWYIMQDWLSGYAYRIDLTLLPFALSGLAALLISWTTVSLHAWRVANTNPINALRCE